MNIEQLEQLVQANRDAQDAFLVSLIEAAHDLTDSYNARLGIGDGTDLSATAHPHVRCIRYDASRAMNKLTAAAGTAFDAAGVNMLFTLAIDLRSLRPTTRIFIDLAVHKRDGAIEFSPWSAPGSDSEPTVLFMGPGEEFLGAIDAELERHFGHDPALGDVTGSAISVTEGFA